MEVGVFAHPALVQMTERVKSKPLFGGQGSELSRWSGSSSCCSYPHTNASSCGKTQSLGGRKSFLGRLLRHGHGLCRIRWRRNSRRICHCKNRTPSRRSVPHSGSRGVDQLTRSRHSHCQNSRYSDHCPTALPDHGCCSSLTQNTCANTDHSRRVWTNALGMSLPSRPYPQISVLHKCLC